MNAGAVPDAAAGSDGLRPLRGLTCLVPAHDNAPQRALLLRSMTAADARCLVHLDRRARETRRALEPLLPEGAALLPRRGATPSPGAVSPWSRPRWR